MKNLLLLSSSRVGTTPYLAHALAMIKDHLLNTDDELVTELLFIPYAGVTISNEEYTRMVQTALSPLNINVVGIHQYDNAKEAILSAKAIAVGGGNTFRLLEQLYRNDIVDAIKQVTSAGTPYIGWSAGSNVAGLSIKTTNDMPIIEPPSFTALNLVNFQLNPHYTDHNPPGHNGETRAQRLAEFMVLNPTTPIVAIVEGTALKVTGDKVALIGDEAANIGGDSIEGDTVEGKNYEGKSVEGYIFKGGEKTVINASSDLNFLLSANS